MRLAGVLMPISSLPACYGIGDFGKVAYDFVDISCSMGFKIWQILPLNPLGYGNSPYQPYSSYAGDEIYISLEKLHEEKLLDELPKTVKSSSRIDYEKVRKLKNQYLKKAYKNFDKKDKDYLEFLKYDFVYNYAVFLTLKKKNNLNSWSTWDKEEKNWIKDKKLNLEKYKDEIDYECFVQYMFYKQWMSLKSYANKKGIKIMGDIPIYVGHDSLDVWENQKAFLLNKVGNPKFIAGVPPDYFSKTGQRWGNPIYDWDYIKENNFDFWLKRIEYNSRLYDIIRIDHFRGFDTYWKINARNKTAMKGAWLEAPGDELFSIIQKKFKDLEIVAEDLGDLRKEVLELRDKYNLKGMKIMQFFFDPDEKNNDFEDRKNMIIYTGTHDNQTVLGFYNSCDEKTKKYISNTFEKYKSKNINEGFLNMCLESIADYAILPVQDILGIDDAGRINTPGTLGEHNWSYKLKNLDGYKNKTEFIKKLLKKYNR